MAIFTLEEKLWTSVRLWLVFPETVVTFPTETEHLSKPLESSGEWNKAIVQLIVTLVRKYNL